MFQYQWFNPKKYTANNTVNLENNENFVDYSNINEVRLSDWQEHCLECAPPHCYNNCENYAEREDKKCCNLWNGMHPDKNFKEYPFAAELKWRVWGKIETIIYPAVLPLGTIMRLDRKGKILNTSVKKISRLIKFISPKYRLNGALTLYSSKFLKKYKVHTNKNTDTFLFQCYSYEEQSLNLCFDLLNERELCYRGKIPLKYGFNQTILTMPPEIDLSKMNGLVRIYPENDMEAHITILFCDFVRLKQPPKSPAQKAKCMVWDLDNTIWNGTLIESEPNSLQLRENVIKAIKMLDEKGIIQSIASKNSHDEAMRELKRLGIDEYFVYPMINWNAKSSNIEAIAKLLNVDINTFVLIDDSVFERNEVLSRHPYMRVYDEGIIDELNELAELDIPITEESSKRREMYQTEAKRKEDYAISSGNNIEFLRSCQIKINIFEPKTEEEILRCYELIQRTNQLNLSAKKYEKEEFYQKFGDENFLKYAVRCEDKYGSYGQIAFILLRISENTVFITEFAMSCRVAEKFVESAVLKWMQCKFGGDIIFSGRRTDKNSLLVNSLIKCGMKDLATSSQEIKLGLEKDVEPICADVVHVEENEK